MLFLAKENECIRESEANLTETKFTYESVQDSELIKISGSQNAKICLYFPICGSPLARVQSLLNLDNRKC